MIWAATQRFNASHVDCQLNGLAITNGLTMFAVVGAYDLPWPVRYSDIRSQVRARRSITYLSTPRGALHRERRDVPLADIIVLVPKARAACSTTILPMD